MRPSAAGLVIDPCIPPSWKGYTVQRVFRGATYNIEVSNPSAVSKGVKQLMVDGSPVEGNVVPIQKQGATISVTVVPG